MLTTRQQELNDILEEAAKSLDISPSDFLKAQKRYNAVGTWLIDGYKNGDYPNSAYEPEIFLQGSMRLGTAVRPFRDGKDVDFDIDLVCQFAEPKEKDNHKNIKSQAGKRLKSHADYERMLEEEGKRCWTLEYAADSNGIGFHLDILPCVAESPADINDIRLYTGAQEKYIMHSIAITHKDKENNIYSWKPGNPKGYAQWFDEIKQPALNLIVEAKSQIIYENNREFFASKEDVPQYMVKTPLQRAIQLLKRHRDMRFANHELKKFKPISMIITTLAAKIYENESDTLSALQNIVNTINSHRVLLEGKYVADHSIAIKKLIEKGDDGKWWIKNPVNPLENFADRWHEDNQARAKAFFQWLEWLKEDIENLLGEGTILERRECLCNCFGEKSINRVLGTALASMASEITSTRTTTNVGEIKSPSRPWGMRS